MFATAPDSGDYVAVAWGASDQGMTCILTWWVGMAAGWMVMTLVVLAPVYRSEISPIVNIRSSGLGQLPERLLSSSSFRPELAALPDTT